jgi:hypothetical protein
MFQSDTQCNALIDANLKTFSSEAFAQLRFDPQVYQMTFNSLLTQVKSACLPIAPPYGEMALALLLLAIADASTLSKGV